MTGAVSHKLVAKKTQPKFKRRYRITRKGWLNLGILAAIIFLIILLIIVLRSPLIRKIEPSNRAVITSNPVSVKIDIGQKYEPSFLSILIDGEDRTAEMNMEQPQEITGKVDIKDGVHRLEVVYKGKCEKRSDFMVDTTPPQITIEQMEVRDDGITAIKGRVEEAVSLKLEGKQISFDREGLFSFIVNRYDYPMVNLEATDVAGNHQQISLKTTPIPKIKGVHVSIWVAADSKLFANLVSLVERTELNSLEIDTKDESGRVGYDSSVELANQLGLDMTKGGIDLGKVMDKCWYKDIYTIARIVCFKDPVLAKKRPDLAVQDKRGKPWGNGQWLDPYSKEVWNYILDLAKEAAANGFDEIQFDYVRFPSDGDTTTCVFPHNDGRAKEEVITDFCRFLAENLKPLGVVLSIDLFGLTASGQGSMGIGQDVTAIASSVDYLSPMVYPSHYHLGEYNIRVPEANPYETVYKSLVDFKKKIEGTGCKLRPWLQDFSLKINYGPKEVKAQIQACYDLGIEEWLLWDPNCTFTEGALSPQQ